MHSVSSHADFRRQLREHALVVVDFTAAWCGPCQRLAPRLDALADELSDIHFCTVDVDDVHAAVADAYDVECMPTILFFVGGRLVSDWTVTTASLAAIRRSCVKMLEQQQESDESSESSESE
jgi:thioredoxin 1